MWTSNRGKLFKSVMVEFSIKKTLAGELELQYKNGLICLRCFSVLVSPDNSSFVATLRLFNLWIASP